MRPVVIIGLGQLGGLFAHGFLRLGHPVVPVVRGADPQAVAQDYPACDLVLVAVGEAELSDVLGSLPDAWKPRVVLVQNELLPRDYEAHHIDQPTLAVVWFEKKRNKPVVELMPTRIYGPAEKQIAGALEQLGLSTKRVNDPLFALVEKNLYILTINIAGLETGGTVGELWRDHRPLAESVAAEVLELQEALAGRRLPREELMKALARAIQADPDHVCTGRSAPARLRRALLHARSFGLSLPTLRAMSSRGP